MKQNLLAAALIIVLASAMLAALWPDPGGTPRPSTDPGMRAAHWRDPARYEFEYRVDVRAADRGELSIWIPWPAENVVQEVLDAEVTAPWPWRLTVDRRFGNRIAYLKGHAPFAGEIILRFLVERRPYRGLPAAEAAPGTPLDPKRHLAADRLVPLTDRIRELAVEQGNGLGTAGEKARTFYDYIYRTMRYGKEGAGWGRGDAVWACNARYGNCTDFHALFVGMARSADVPARFVIGFPIPPGAPSGTVDGYHCWAEFYDPDRGWIPVDASEAWKARQPDAYFGALPNDRIEFAAGRDLVLEPPQRGAPLNYFIDPYAELDGRPLATIEKRLRFRRLAPDTPSLRTGK